MVAGAFEANWDRATMLQFGILTPSQYNNATKARRLSGSGIALTLLELSDHPTSEEILRFDEISYSLRTSNGTTRMTFRHRMPDVDKTCLKLLREHHPTDAQLVLQDRAASNCLTSKEWAEQLLPAFPKARLEASDRLLFLLRISLRDGATYILEPAGHPLQYIKPPFAVRLCPREPYRYPFNHLIAARAKWALRKVRLPTNLVDSAQQPDYTIRKISCVHPEARILVETQPRFSIQARSVFDRTPSLDVLRTMNILNLAYFSTAQLLEGVRAAFESLKPGGLWIVGRTREEDRTNHVSFFRRTERNWQVLDRIGGGSEIEALVTSFRDGKGAGEE
jgi:hypothetical protein